MRPPQNPTAAPPAAAGQVRDAGTTLVELLVTMVLLAMFSSLFLSALLPFNRGLVKQTNVADAADGTRVAFLRFDRQVRYADAVNAPETASGSEWVEYRWKQATPAGIISRCTQWRVVTATGLLQEREWLESAGSPGAAPWTTVATGISGFPAPAPGVGRLPVFSLVSDPGLRAQQLTVALTSTRGAVPGAVGTQVTLTAANSPSNAVPSPAVCPAPRS